MQLSAMQIFREAVDSVTPSTLLRGLLGVSGDRLLLGNETWVRRPNARLLVAGAGKAAAAMAVAVERILEGWITEGVVVTKYGHCLPTQRVRCREAAHPVPDEQSIMGGREIASLLGESTAGDLVLLLVSGGASSLLFDLPDGISLDDLQDTTVKLLASGANIHEMNTVRKHLSPRLKGGHLAKLAWPATVHSLVISDVPGDDLSTIASGPCTPDPTTFADTQRILDHYGPPGTWRPAVSAYVHEGIQGDVPETPKPGDPVFSRVFQHIIGSNKVALEVAAAAAAKAGYQVVVLDNFLLGEARDCAASFVDQLLKHASDAPFCLIAGGETTVTIRGSGKGGRNQEFALAALCLLQENPVSRDITILAAGTDGTDGPTDATGALVNHQIIERTRRLGIDPGQYLDNNDAYHFFRQVDGLVITGPTQTNVMDIVIGLVDPVSQEGNQ